MKNVKHTKGPWTVDPEYPYDVLGGDGDERTAPLLVVNQSHDIDTRPEALAVRYANARLISAAPVTISTDDAEMLIACLKGEIAKARERAE